MTRDDIIEYSINVEESELHMVVSSPHSEYARINADGSCWIDWDECKKAAQVWDEEKVVHSAFAKLLLHVAAAEREACAKVCEDIPVPQGPTELTHIPTLERCAAAIRARGQ